MSHGLPERYEPPLALGMARVLNDSVEWITEIQDGLI